MFECTLSSTKSHSSDDTENVTASVTNCGQSSVEAIRKLRILMTSQKLSTKAACNVNRFSFILWVTQIEFVAPCAAEKDKEQRSHQLCNAKCIAYDVISTRVTEYAKRTKLVDRSATLKNSKESPK